MNTNTTATIHRNTFGAYASLDDEWVTSTDHARLAEIANELSVLAARLRELHEDSARPPSSAPTG